MLDVEEVLGSETARSSRGSFQGILILICFLFVSPFYLSVYLISYKYLISSLLLLQKADKNGDGVLSADEYYRILKEHGIQITRDEIVQLMNIADKDHDGYGKP